MDGVHLLLDDLALLVGFIRLGAPKDHGAALGHGELLIFFFGTVHQVASLWGRLLGLALLAEGAMDVALHGSIVLEKMFWLPPMERVGGLEHLFKVFWACSVPMGLRSSDAVGHGDHLLLATLPVLVPPIVASLG